MITEYNTNTGNPGTSNIHNVNNYRAYQSTVNDGTSTINCYFSGITEIYEAHFYYYDIIVYSY